MAEEFHPYPPPYRLTLARTKIVQQLGVLLPDRNSRLWRITSSRGVVADLGLKLHRIPTLSNSEIAANTDNPKPIFFNQLSGRVLSRACSKDFHLQRFNFVRDQRRLTATGRNVMRAISFLRGLLVAIVVLLASLAAFSQVAISVSFGPPPLPVYEQPVCPGEGYIWAPGYWAWDDDYDDYYWVPGTWVEAPEVGYLWTPPWWGWENGVYLFHAGWWGPEVGFYGGINYGYGYFGDGFVGGRWEGGHFFYNRSVTNINVVNIRNVYNERVNIR
jgi:hypothetical protein